MKELIIDTWQVVNVATTKSNALTHTVLPDGCRDLIYKECEGEAPTWYVCPLFDRATEIDTSPSTTMIGFRLRAGMNFNESQLLGHISAKSPDCCDVANALYDAWQQSAFVSDALALFSKPHTSVASAATDLGVSIRTLQRHVLAATHRTPVYWLQLSRARRTARAICSSRSLLHTAIEFGFADQAHMNREFRRWFNLSPATFLAESALQSEIAMPGYGDD